MHMTSPEGKGQEGACPEMVPDASPLHLLSAPVRQWVNDQGWTRLRPVQVQALKPVLAGNTDVIISAATASGKTEAAFLPALSRVHAGAQGTSILYVSPLRALINDQYRRLADLAGRVGLPVTPWHSDLSSEARHAYLRSPHGVLLITPESLEAFVLRHTDFCRQAFAELGCVIIDEFHSLADSERGVQLMSLLRRIEALLRRRVPRIALSATFGDVQSMAARLRPGGGDWPCCLVNGGASARARFEVRTYLVAPPYLRQYVADAGRARFMDELYLLLAGGHHLVFANSRRRVEEVAAALAERCQEEGRPNEFFPHHGSLSRELRERLERRLQGEAPATAVCTMTLELGIDIGNMDSIVQLEAPGSVASLRQRLGRAGRRGEEQVLRLFLLEERAGSRAHVADRLHLGLFQSLAVLRLLEEGWCEPALPPRPQYSTLVQQILSSIGQYGGLRPSLLWHLLCATGPFPVDQGRYLQLLKGLVARNIIYKSENNELCLTDRGRALTGGRDFCTAFRQPPDYTLVSGERILGRLPMDAPLDKGERILFAGRAWQVTGIDAEKRVVQLTQDTQGQAPRFSGVGQCVHDRVRATMLDIYNGGRVAGHCSYPARNLLRDGRAAFSSLGLNKFSVLASHSSVRLFPWRGDRFCRTLSALLRSAGLDVRDTSGVVDVRDVSWNQFSKKLRLLLAGGRPSALSLTAGIQDFLQEKFAAFVDPELLAEDSALRFYEADAAWAWLEELTKGTGRVNFC